MIANKQMMVGSLISLCIILAQAEVKTTAWRTDGVDDWDWTKEGNFSNGTPLAGDIVEIPDGFTVYATNAAARLKLAGLGQISPQGLTATLVLDVPVNETVTFSGPIARDWWCGFGVFLKRGAGLAVLDSEGGLSSGDSYDYALADILVEEGVLSFKQSAAKNAQFRHVDVSAGAVLRTVVNKQTTVARLTGLGMVTNTAASAQVLSLGTTTFDGILAKGITLKAAGRVTLTNPRSTFTGTDYLTGNSGAMADGNGTLCVPSFGLIADAESPVGRSSSFNIRGNGGGVLYLGTGPTTTDRDFLVDQEEQRGYPAFIDGGASGGLVLAGRISPFNWKKTAHEACFVLTGSNAAPCVVAGRIDEGSSATTADSDGIKAPISFRKQGTGIWRFNHNWSHTFASCLAVDEGTLQFETLGEAGETTSLGNATRLFELSCGGKVADLPTVDYAYTLGSDGKEGVFEYVGSNLVFCTTRPIALAGTGAIRNNTSRPFRFSGVKVLTAGAKTLKLTGDGTGENEIAGIGDAADRPISVVKEGVGTWTLNGSNTFSGTLSVKAGTLIIRKPAAAYTWFRWNLGEGYLAPRNCQFWFTEFGLYDKSGTRVNTEMSFNGGATAPSLEPGEVAYPVLRQFGQDTATLYRLFDGTINSGTIAYWTNATKSNHNGRNESLVLRLAAEAAVPTSYDVAMVAHTTGNNDRAPKFWTLEGSSDGIHWNLVHTVTDCGDPMTGKRMWCGAVREYTGDVNEPEGKHTDGYQLAAPKTPAFTVLDAVSAISISAGATLKAEGEAIALDKLMIDATDAGTVDGFAFAASGTLEIVNAPAHGDVELPAVFANVSGLSNLRNWTCSVNGEPMKRQLRIVDGKFFLRVSGLRLLVR